ncbi:MAG: 2,3-bisphosphoglycerate-independent phosphoglycerate mutase [Candidatus Bathyarchaeota archaeon]|nr:2,3-bisphosphoglycerate-independent phosphoglycerate mutase [Candidatus Bathyarchaeota archaeon A05DMB-5]MDH7557130.1 2,3-bisphosphoglycerate-independent phosphoglycerate mutase [Candidatus Bathyarchaeota archaeon]
MKSILVIGDGMADRPVKELSWKTPLEAAYKPSLNKIAKTGICGIMDVIAPGIPPGSDTATLALLGYDAVKVYSGRGAFEAIGSGINVSPGDVAFRCNFATVDDDFVVLDRRAGRIANEDASKLAESLQKIKPIESSIKVVFKNTVQHRAALLLRGPTLSTAISDSDPEKVGEKVLEIKALDETLEAKHTAKILNDLLQKFHKTLKEHPVNKKRVKHGLPPANVILCRGAGTVPNIKPLSEVYGVNTACVSAVSLIKGVCKVAGMKLIDVKGATGTPQTNFVAKAKAAVQALKTYDFVLLHVKAPDVPSHDGNVKQKVSVIEKIDQMLGYLLEKVDLNETYLAVTADHTTSSVTRNHEGDPVPVAITGPHVLCDDVAEFGERTCAKGGLNRIRGIDLMPILMNLIGKTRKFGA